VWWLYQNLRWKLGVHVACQEHVAWWQAPSAKD
jgi:hypothetical protein